MLDVCSKRISNLRKELDGVRLPVFLAMLDDSHALEIVVSRALACVRTRTMIYFGPRPLPSFNHIPRVSANSVDIER